MISKLSGLYLLITFSKNEHYPHHSPLVNYALRVFFSSIHIPGKYWNTKDVYFFLTLHSTFLSLYFYSAVENKMRTFSRLKTGF